MVRFRLGMKQIKITNYIFPLILFFIITAISISNYEPGTWLSGWDTLHPEFNFVLNLKRVLFGVWREEQGLGTVAIHSHMAELPRILVLWILSFVLPLSVLRYLFFFICLLVGPLGVYYFIIHTNKNNNFYIKIAGFIGALSYLLNLGTLQQFYVPFEMFATQYAFLPWLLLCITLYIQNHKNKYLVTLFLLSFFSAPQAYAATLNYAFLGFIVLFIFSFVLLSKQSLLMAAKPIIFLLLPNLFWFLPNIYATVLHGVEVTNSSTNQLFSPEAYLQSQEYGNLENVLLNKSFLFSWQEYNFPKQDFVFLLDEWKNHLSLNYVIYAEWLIVAISLLGLIASVFSKSKLSFAFITTLVFCLFFLFNDNPPFWYFYQLLYNKIPLFKEVMRTPYTKFSIQFGFLFSFWLSYAVIALGKLPRHIIQKSALIIVSSLITISLILITKPFFFGNLISPSMRINIPTEYSELNTWFNSQPFGRIAKLPLHNRTGWVYYDWGYQGAGFSWFGIASPQLDRDFDRWNKYNETLYNELSFAFYNNEPETFEKVLQKYDVKYLLFDESVINPGGNKELLSNNTFDEFINSSSHLSLVKQINFLKIYQTDFDTNPIKLLTNYSFINSDQAYSEYDSIYIQKGDYVATSEFPIYPYTNFDNRSLLTTTINKDSIDISKLFPQNTARPEIYFPYYFDNSNEIPLKIYAQKSSSDLKVRIVYAGPQLIVNDGSQIIENNVELRETFKLTSHNLAYLAINDKVFSLENNLSTDQEIYLGSLFTNPDITVRLFSNTPRKVNLDKILLTTKARLCQNPNAISKAEYKDNSLTISVDKEAICFGNTINIPTGLLKTNFNFLATNAYPFFCLNNCGSCLNARPEDGPSYQEQLVVTKPISWIDFVAQGNDANNQTGSVSFSQIGLTHYPLLVEKSYSLTDKFSEHIFSFFTLPQENITKLTARIPLIEPETESFSVSRGYPEAYNCSTTKTGQATKTLETPGVSYTASEKGVSCDYFVYHNLKYQNSYLLNITGENKSGRSLKIYLYNQNTKRFDIENLLSESAFQNNIYLLPKKYDNSGYTLNLETRSFGRIDSDNTIKNLSFLKIPINWLRQVHLGRDSRITSTSTLKSFNKLSSVLYQAEIASDSKSFLTLSQSFDPGWIAFTTKGNLLPHTNFNTWANAWSTPEGEHTILIFFWPQLLEWFGLALIPIVFIYLIHNGKQMAQTDNLAGSISSPKRFRKLTADRIIKKAKKEYFT